MHIVGLKRITAKQLALSSQTLAAVQALIPSVSRRCSEALTDRQRVMLGEFDKVKDDYRKHRQDIVDKLVAIMRDVWARSNMVRRGVVSRGAVAAARVRSHTPLYRLQDMPWHVRARSRTVRGARRVYRH